MQNRNLLVPFTRFYEPLLLVSKVLFRLKRMDQSILQPKIALLYNFAKMGLIHARRFCEFCNMPMKLTSSIELVGYRDDNQDIRAY